jgi:DNA-binding transcriptional MerR regulator
VLDYATIAAVKRRELAEERRSARRRRDAPAGFDFEEPNLAALWARLALTATQLSQLTGVSRRQVEWWRRRGYLTPSPELPDRFSGDAVTLALLIKQGLDVGLPLSQAYELATRHLAEQLARGLVDAVPAEGGSNQRALADLERKLLATQNTIGLVIEAISPLVKRAERVAAQGS